MLLQFKTESNGLGPPRPQRRGRSVEKDHPINIDAQDAQDNQEGKLLHKRLTQAMIACGFAVV